ncbi:hypothetical protein AUC45_11125 [Erythrobacter sp. YT30]|nr:hypothetical protein AUC45_11125 [Erythrobacter sp. YT30]
MTLPQMRRQQKRQLKQIESYSKGGSGKINRERLNKAVQGYLNSRTVRALAIAKAEGVEDNEMASRANALRAKLDAAQDWKSALANCRKHVRWHYEPKSYLGVRQVCSLPTHLKAWHMITKRLLEATHSPGKHIADWSGRGRDRQIKHITEILTCQSLSVVVADVSSAFGSVQPAALHQFLDLPDELIRGALDARTFTFSQNVKKSRDEVFLKYPCYRLPSSGIPPQGLLQGSPASNAIFGVLLNDLAHQLPESLGCFVYCDNIVVVTENEHRAQSVSNALAEYFIRHPAGPFSIKSEIKCLSNSGFEHLGYAFRWSYDRPWVGMSEKNYDRFFSSLEHPSSVGPNGMDYLEACFSACTHEAVWSYARTAIDNDPACW